MHGTMDVALLTIPVARGWLMTGLGDAVRQRRKALRLTQVELATRAGTDQSTISQVERGSRQWPTREVREGIARALGWTNLQLLVAAGEVDPQEAGVTSGDREEELQAIVRPLDDESFKRVRDFALFTASSARAR